MKKSIEKHRKTLDVKRDFPIILDNQSDERVIAWYGNSRMKEIREYEAFSQDAPDRLYYAYWRDLSEEEEKKLTYEFRCCMWE